MVARGETVQKMEMVKVMVQVPLAGMLQEKQHVQSYTKLTVCKCNKLETLAFQWLVPTDTWYWCTGLVIL